MDRRFLPLNALLALCSNVRTGWPRPLFDAGYQLKGLEFPVSSDGERVVPDVVAWSSNEGHFFLGEAKSGNNLDEDQARRYANVQPNVLVQSLEVTVVTESPVNVDIIYAVLDEDERIERVLQGFEKCGLSFPVLAIGETQVKRVSGTFKSPALEAALRNPILVPGPPPGLITIDADSEDSDFDRVVYTSLVAAMSRKLPAMTITALAGDALPYFAHYPNGYQGQLKRRVSEAARRVADKTPDLFVFEPSSGTRNDPRILFVSSPEDLDPRGRTQKYQSLAARFGAPERRRRTIVNENQLTFFDRGDLERELAELDIEDDGDGEEVIYGPQ